MDTYIAPFHGLTDYLSVISNRDESIGGGFRRPKAFTAETSHAALAYTVGVCALAWLTHRHKSISLSVVLSICGLIALRSPVLLFSLFFIGICASRRTAAIAVDKNDLVHRIFAYILFAIPLVTLLAYVALGIFAKRLEVLNSGDDYSTTYRTYGSLFSAWATLKVFPLFGVGIGSIDLAEQPITQTFLSLGVPSSSVMEEWRFQIQNLPSALLIYLGGIGTAIYCMFMATYFRLLAGRVSGYFWIIFLLLAATTPAFYSPKLNTYMFIVLAVNFVWNRDEANKSSMR